MNVEKITVKNFRNIKDLTLEPCEGINVIFGENAQGKTSLLESIWLFSGFRSFRGAKESELISFGEDFSVTELSFNAMQRSQTAKMIIGARQKRILLNGVPLTASSRLIGNFNCVVFSPTYLSLIRGNPSERRKFIDCALCQINPRYARLLTEYNRVLFQRNALIKQIRGGGSGEMLSIFSESLSRLAVSLINARLKYLKLINEAAGDIYNGISSKREELEIFYKMRTGASRFDAIDKEVDREEILSLMKSSESGDITAGSTLIGPHHDELEIKINGSLAKSYGSQGQQRSAALSLKLGEARILKSVTGENPVALLDDVMSELDVSRQNYILNHIKDWQVFITCCEPSSVTRLLGGKKFEIKDGALK